MGAILQGYGGTAVLTLNTQHFGRVCPQMDESVLILTTISTIFSLPIIFSTMTVRYLSIGGKFPTIQINSDTPFLETASDLTE